MEKTGSAQNLWITGVVSVTPGEVIHNVADEFRFLGLMRVRLPGQFVQHRRALHKLTTRAEQWLLSNGPSHRGAGQARCQGEG